MNLQESVEKSKVFVSPEEREITLMSGEKFRYSTDMPIGRSMKSSAYAVEWLKSHDLTYEDVFVQDEEGGDGKGLDLLRKLLTEECDKEGTIEPLIKLMGSIIGKDSTWVSENIREEDALGIVVPFFLLKLGYTIKKITTWNKAMEEIIKMIPVSEGSDTEKSLPGVSDTEDVPSETLTNTSSSTSQSEKS